MCVHVVQEVCFNDFSGLLGELVVKCIVCGCSGLSIGSEWFGWLYTEHCLCVELDLLYWCEWFSVHLLLFLCGCGVVRCVVNGECWQGCLPIVYRN